MPKNGRARRYRNKNRSPKAATAGLSLPGFAAFASPASPAPAALPPTAAQAQPAAPAAKATQAPATISTTEPTNKANLVTTSAAATSVPTKEPAHVAASAVGELVPAAISAAEELTAKPAPHEAAANQVVELGAAITTIGGPAVAEPAPTGAGDIQQRIVPQWFWSRFFPVLCLMYSTDGTFCKVLAEFILVRFVLNYGLHANEALFCKDFMRWEMYCPKGSGKVAAREALADLGRAVLPKAITRAVSKYDVRRRKEYEKTGVPKGALSPTLCDVIIETTGLPLEKGVFSWSALFTYMLALVNAAGTGSRANPLGLTAWQLLICEKLKVTPEKILEWRADAGEWCTTTIPPALPAPPTPLPTQEVEKATPQMMELGAVEEEKTEEVEKPTPRIVELTAIIEDEEEEEEEAEEPAATTTLAPVPISAAPAVVKEPMPTAAIATAPSLFPATVKAPEQGAKEEPAPTSSPAPAAVKAVFPIPRAAPVVPAKVQQQASKTAPARRCCNGIGSLCCSALRHKRRNGYGQGAGTRGYYRQHSNGGGYASHSPTSTIGGRQGCYWGVTPFGEAWIYYVPGADHYLAYEIFNGHFQWMGYMIPRW